MRMPGLNPPIPRWESLFDGDGVGGGEVGDREMRVGDPDGGAGGGVVKHPAAVPNADAGLKSPDSTVGILD